MTTQKVGTRILGAVAFALLVGLPVAWLGCLDGRFPTCKDNDECKKTTDGGAPVCFDLRCVECHYDDDCTEGKTCSRANTCQGLGTKQTTDEPTDGGADPATKWEPGGFDDCTRDCKDADCVHACDARFPKGAASARAKPKKKPPPPPAN